MSNPIFLYKRLDPNSNQTLEQRFLSEVSLDTDHLILESNKIIGFDSIRSMGVTDDKKRIIFKFELDTNESFSLTGTYINPENPFEIFVVLKELSKSYPSISDSKMASQIVENSLRLSNSSQGGTENKHELSQKFSTSSLGNASTSQYGNTSTSQIGNTSTSQIGNTSTSQIGTTISQIGNTSSNLGKDDVIIGSQNGENDNLNNNNKPAVREDLNKKIKEVHDYIKNHPKQPETKKGSLDNAIFKSQKNDNQSVYQKNDNQTTNRNDNQSFRNDNIDIYVSQNKNSNMAYLESRISKLETTILEQNRRIEAYRNEFDSIENQVKRIVYLLIFFAALMILSKL